ncbi:MAG: hypothetical protein ACYST9_02805, partial [Planctomycetota bacterium]
LAVVQSAAIGINVVVWLTDSKIVLIIASWVLLAVVLVLRKMALLKEKTITYITMAVFFLILFAIIGSAIFCSTKHDFSGGGVQTAQPRE